MARRRVRSRRIASVRFEAISASSLINPHIRASTSRNPKTAAPTNTGTSTRSPSDDSKPSNSGPTSDAVASAIKRVRVKVKARTGAGELIVRIDGCSAAAPHSVYESA